MHMSATWRGNFDRHQQSIFSNFFFLYGDRNNILSQAYIIMGTGIHIRRPVLAVSSCGQIAIGNNNGPIGYEHAATLSIATDVLSAAVTPSVRNPMEKRFEFSRFPHRNDTVRTRV